MGCCTRIGFDGESTALQCLRNNVETNKHVTGASGTAKLMLHTRESAEKRPTPVARCMSWKGRTNWLGFTANHASFSLRLALQFGESLCRLDGMYRDRRTEPANHPLGRSLQCHRLKTRLVGCYSAFTLLNSKVSVYVSDPGGVLWFIVCHCFDQIVRSEQGVCLKKLGHTV